MPHPHIHPPTLPILIFNPARAPRLVGLVPVSSGLPARAVEWLVAQDASEEGRSLDLSVPYPDAGTAPVHMAVQSGDVSLVLCMLAQGADVDARADSGDTPLHFACGLGHYSIAQLLILAGADTSLANEAGQPLGYWRSRSHSRPHPHSHSHAHSHAYSRTLSHAQNTTLLSNNTGEAPLEVCRSAEVAGAVGRCASVHMARMYRGQGGGVRGGIIGPAASSVGTGASAGGGSGGGSGSSSSSGSGSGGSSVTGRGAFAPSSPLPGRYSTGAAASHDCHAYRLTSPLEGQVLAASYDTAANVVLEVHGRVAKLQKDFLGAIEMFAKEKSCLANPGRRTEEKIREEMDRHMRGMLKLAGQRPQLVTMRHSATLFMQVAAPAGATPLHFASGLGADEVVTWLLAHDAVSAWCRDMQGRTPLHYAAKEFRESSCWLLRRAMQAETSQDPVGELAPADLTGTTPLGYATLLAGPGRKGGRPAEGVVAALFSAGDASILPRSPQRMRTGHAAMPLSPSPNPIPRAPATADAGTDGARAGAGGTGTGEDRAPMQVSSLCYAHSEAMGWRPTMEDRAVTACPLDAGAREGSVLKDCALFAVLDGHGGADVSDAMSTLLAGAVSRTLLEQCPRSDDSKLVLALPALLHTVCMDVDAELSTVPALALTRTARGGFTAGSFAGSTMVAALVTPSHVVVANVGDSRAVLARVYSAPGGGIGDTAPLEGNYLFSPP